MPAMASPSPSSIQTTVSVRRYLGEYEAHAHDHAQVLFGWEGRLEMEIGGRASFVDSSCGLIVPAGVAHGFLAAAGARVMVVDAPAQSVLGGFRRFAITRRNSVRADMHDADGVLARAFGAPRILARRGVDLTRLNAALDLALHEPWSTARMAALFFLSQQRFHARLLELTGDTPQQYLRKRRMELAVQQLRAGRTLEATASRVGYATASALAFALKRDLKLVTRQLRQG